MKHPALSNLLYQTTRAAFLAQEKNSLLGILWHLLNPLAMAAVLYVVFSNVGLFTGIENYGLFILAGIVHFNFLANATTRAANALSLGRSLVLDTSGPPEILVFQAVLMELFTFAVEIVLVLALVAIVGEPGLGWSHLSYAPVALGLIFLVAGLSLILGALVVFLSDLQYVWSVATRLLFFLTPIFYTLEMLEHPWAARLVGLNPLAQIVELGRGVLLRGEWLDPTAAVVVLIAPAAVFALGWLLFQRLKPLIPDYI